MEKNWLIDAGVVKHQVERLVATAIYRGLKSIPVSSLESHSPHEYMKGYERGALDVANIVLAQTPVDAVEVVRCKDCKHGRQPWLEGQAMVKCMVGKTMLVTPEHFCSYGERRTP